MLLAALLLVISMPAMAQNTKGDKPPSDRETRFRKTDNKQKKVRTKKGRKTSDLRAYKPRGKSKSGERAGQPVGRVRRIKPGSSGGSARNVYPQRGRFVHNPSRRPGRGDGAITRHPGRANKVKPRSVSESARNVYPQRGRFVNNSSPRPSRNDRPVSNRSEVARASRIQGKDRKPKRQARIRPRSASRSYVSHRTINIQARFPRPKRKVERAITHDIAGRRVRTKNFESKKPDIIKARSAERFSRSSKQRIPPSQYQRYGRYKNFSSAGAVSTSRGKRTSVPRSVSHKAKRIYPQAGRYVNNPSVTPRRTERAESNRRTLNKLQGLQTRDKKPGRKTQIVPRSASRSFTARKSTNTWAHFPRPKRKDERAITRDIAGKKLRTRNYESERPGVITPEFQPYYGRKRVGDRPYRTGTGGGYSTATRTGRAWRGDIARRSIRGIKTPRRDSPSRVMPGGYKSATQPGEKRAGREPIPVRQPGISAEVLRHATGKVKGRRAVKGGGSVSGRLWNNKGNSLPPRTPRVSGAGDFQGNMKTKRPEKGGGSISGKLWNNKRTPLPARSPGEGARGIDRFQGNIKSERPKKGGGSISGRLWNNRNQAIPNRTPPNRASEVAGYPGKMRRFEDGQPGFSDQGEEYTGSIKAKRPERGGGSVSGKVWNNKRTPIPPRTPGKGADGIEKFQGNIKKVRPEKGGGSVSGKLWNNKATPIPVRTPGVAANRMGRYQGTLKASRPEKGGGSVSGKLWNNKETPINVKTPGVAGQKAGNYTGTIKQSRFRSAYVKNPNSAQAALKKGRPTKSTYQEGEVQTKVRQYHYVKNRNASENATKVREPGKSFARASDFQGNIKMQKFQLFERSKKQLHPDARFIRTNKNNVDGERDVLTNFKLWWARLFQKEETQPENLKDKGRKPRYDKGEQGLWYD